MPGTTALIRRELEHITGQTDDLSEAAGVLLENGRSFDPAHRPKGVSKGTNKNYVRTASTVLLGR